MLFAQMGASTLPRSIERLAARPQRCSPQPLRQPQPRSGPRASPPQRLASITPSHHRRPGQQKSPAAIGRACGAGRIGRQPIGVPADPRGRWLAPARDASRRRRATLRDAHMWCSSRRGGVASRLAGGLGAVQLARLLAETRPISTRSSGLMNPSLIRDPPARRPCRERSAQWCSSRISAAAESLGISAMTSQASSSENALDALGRRLAPAWAPATMPSSPSMPRPTSAPTTLPTSIASSLVRVLRCATSISPSASLCTASASMTRTVPVSFKRSSSATISPWNSGCSKPEQADQLNRPDGHGSVSLVGDAPTLTRRIDPRLTRMG